MTSEQENFNSLSIFPFPVYLKFCPRHPFFLRTRWKTNEKAFNWHGYKATNPLKSEERTRKFYTPDICLLTAEKFKCEQAFSHQNKILSFSPLLHSPHTTQKIYFYIFFPAPFQVFRENWISVKNKIFDKNSQTTESLNKEVKMSLGEIPRISLWVWHYYFHIR